MTGELEGYKFNPGEDALRSKTEMPPNRYPVIRSLEKGLSRKSIWLQWWSWHLIPELLWKFLTNTVCTNTTEKLLWESGIWLLIQHAKDSGLYNQTPTAWELIRLPQGGPEGYNEIRAALSRNHLCGTNGSRACTFPCSLLLRRHCL